jgi:hypothetical protein
LASQCGGHIETPIAIGRVADVENADALEMLRRLIDKQGSSALPQERCMKQHRGRRRQDDDGK